MGDENELKIKDEEKDEVRFVINTYEDIFSDFDPRPFSQKGLSEDFLKAAKTATIDKSDKIDFVFLMPDRERKIKDETMIKYRLKKHFKKHLELLKKEKRKVVKRGSFFVGIGILLMLAATFLFFKFKEESFLASFFIIFLEPASWFLFWEGLDQLIFDSKKVDPNLDFYKKMADAAISFGSV